MFAYTDFRVGACLAGVYHLHAGNLSLQCGYGVDHRLVGDFIAFNVGDGARKVSLLGAAITDDNGFGQHLRVVFHLDVDYRLAAYLDSLLHHAYMEKSNVFSGWPDGVPAVYVGNHAIGGSPIRWHQSAGHPGHQSRYRLLFSPADAATLASRHTVRSQVSQSSGFLLGKVWFFFTLIFSDNHSVSL